MSTDCQSSQNLTEQLRNLSTTIAVLEKQVGCQPWQGDRAILLHEIVDALRRVLSQLQVQCYSTYHACAAIAEIARAGLDRDYPGNPYLSSIEALALREDEHGVFVSDALATCEVMLGEITPLSSDCTHSIAPAEALANARGWIETALHALESHHSSDRSHHELVSCNE